MVYWLFSTKCWSNAGIHASLISLDCIAQQGISSLVTEKKCLQLPFAITLSRVLNSTDEAALIYIGIIIFAYIDNLQVTINLRKKNN